jgi:2-hydroxyacyl-CoA lyase 1
MDPHEFLVNRKADVSLCGDVKTILGQFNKVLEKSKTPLCDYNGPWWKQLKDKVAANTEVSLKMQNNPSIPMNYYSVFKYVEQEMQNMKEDYILVSEGSNTMDIARTIITNNKGK